MSSRWGWLVGEAAWGGLLVAGLLGSGQRVIASDQFWMRWGDGRAELSGYQITTPRYGELRQGTVVLIYVTEDLDRRTLVKDDLGQVAKEDRMTVLKLNHVLKFQTGIYPYSVMTSVFARLDEQHTFPPVKIALSSQEWCGHVYHVLRPAAGAVESELHSYFGAEGDRWVKVPIPSGTLYEDDLLIQLRELTGPFAGGKDWKGMMIPSLWSLRKAHQELKAVTASIQRERVMIGNQALNRFTVVREGDKRVIFVETGGAHRVMRWEGSDGEVALIKKTARLPYWTLNHLGDEKFLSKLGLTGL